MAAASMENTVVMFHPVKGRVVLDPSQVVEYRAAGYSEKPSEAKADTKPAKVK